MQTFNFNENKIQTLDLETLRATYKENDVYGNPLKDVYHYQVITQILDICKANTACLSRCKESVECRD